MAAARPSFCCLDCSHGSGSQSSAQIVGMSVRSCAVDAISWRSSYTGAEVVEMRSRRSPSIVVPDL